MDAKVEQKKAVAKKAPSVKVVIKTTKNMIAFGRCPPGHC